MTITIEQLRVRVGLDSADATRDADIIAAQAIANNVLEGYLDRTLTEGQYTEEFVHCWNNHVSLKAYPLISIDSVAGAEPSRIFQHHHDSARGLLFFDGAVADHKMTVTYTGGYGATYPMPPALELALLLCFDQVWGTMNANADGVDGSGAIIKSISSDGANVQFDVSASGGALDSTYDDETGLPVSVVGLVRPFRREFC